jgi:hypothetical protein
MSNDLFLVLGFVALFVLGCLLLIIELAKWTIRKILWKCASYDRKIQIIRKQVESL